MTNNAKYCETCGHTVSLNAEQCPNCGEPRGKKGRFSQLGKVLAVGIPLSLAVLSGALGVWEYSKAQNWKRREFMAQEAASLRNDSAIRHALQMLDWNSRFYHLSANPNDSVLITDDSILAALTPHPKKPGGYTAVESQIRDSFDALFDRLEVFDSYIDADLIKASDLKPYVGYYVRNLGDPDSGRKPPQFVSQVSKYLSCYQYGGVQRLMGRYNLTPDTAAVPDCNAR